MEPENTSIGFWPGAETPDLGLLECRSMSQSTLPTNEAVAEPPTDERPPDRPLEGARRTVRETILEGKLPDFDVYRALCDLSIPVSVTDLERRDD